VLGLVAVLLLVLWPTVAQAQEGEWEWHNSPAQGNRLRAVWGNSGSDVFAVGDGGTILHYDGVDWSNMDSGTSQPLYDVWGSSGSDVFAVGDGGTILHYDGMTWNAMSSHTSVRLEGVWGSSGRDVFAVGHVSVNGDTVLHYDGTAWHSMTIGATSRSRRLYGVWGSSSHDVFAVGGRGTVLHYDGAVWSVMRTALPMDPYPDYYYDVWGSSASDVFVVGSGRTGVVILHYDGVNQGSGYVDNSYGSLRSVWGSGEDDVFAVGGTILHYDGVTWSAMSNPSVQLYGVWGSSGSDVFAVGGYGIILHYSGPPPDAEEPDVDAPVVPESSTLLLLGLGGAVLVAYFGLQAWTRRRTGVG
jgi:hypothetical protein